MSLGRERRGAPEVAVLAGRGKTGRAVCAALSRGGAVARPLGREAWPHLPGALAGCAAVYVIAPNMTEDEAGYVERVLAAAGRAGVARVVYHSVVAPYAPQMPHHVNKARAEDLVRRTAAEWTLLQPGAYVQNFVPALASGEPVLRVPYHPARRFGLVDLLDVGEAAATVLLDDGHQGATYELAGPGPVSVDDVAAAASAVLDRRVRAERVGLDAWAAGEGAGLEPRVREWLLAMFGYYDGYGLPAGSLALRGLLARAPYRLEETLARELRAGQEPR